MAEHGLDASEVGPTFQQISRKGMAQHVGRHAILWNAGTPGELSK